MYAGGMRSHPSLNESSLLFQGLDNVFTNSLSTLPLGGAMGGSDFSSAGKSGEEIQAFYKSYINNFFYIMSNNLDVITPPYLGIRNYAMEVLNHQYKKLSKSDSGICFPGKQIPNPNPNAEVIFILLQEFLLSKNDTLKNKKIAISGFDNLAWGVVTKATQLGAKVITLSGPDGYIYDPDGVSGEKIDYMLELNATNNDIIAPYAEEFDVEFNHGKRPWEVKFDIAICCFTQNEIDIYDAKQLIQNNVICIVEGSNYACTPEAVELFRDNNVQRFPSTLTNLGYVYASFLEYSSNRSLVPYSKTQIEDFIKQQTIVTYNNCLKFAKEYDSPNNLAKGANLYAFDRLVRAVEKN